MTRPSSALAGLALAGAAAWSLACSSPSSPVQAERLSQPMSGSTHTYVRLMLTGTILDENDAGAAGATVAAPYQPGTQMPAVTDASGRFALSLNLDLSVWPLATVTATKDGFDTTTNVANFEGFANTSQTLRLYRPLPVAAGGSAHVAFPIDGNLCGLELEYVCRHVIVSAPTSGNVSIDLTPDDPAKAVCLGPVAYPFTCSTHEVIAVAAGHNADVYLVGVQRSGTAGTITATLAGS